jgi:hypothetical protein
MIESVILRTERQHATLSLPRGSLDFQAKPEAKTMKIASGLFIGATLALNAAMPVVAQAANQAGGVPALDGRVTALESSVAAQGTAETALPGQVGTLHGQLSALQGQLAALQTHVTALEGHTTLFALVNRDGTLCASNGVLFSDHARDKSVHWYLHTPSSSPGTSHCAPLPPPPSLNTMVESRQISTGRGAALPTSSSRPTSSPLPSSMRTVTLSMFVSPSSSRVDRRWAWAEHFAFP